MFSEKYLRGKGFIISRCGNSIVLHNDIDKLNQFMYLMFESTYVTKFYSGQFEYIVYDYHKTGDFTIVRDGSDWGWFSIPDRANEIKWE